MSALTFAMAELGKLDLDVKKPNWVLLYMNRTGNTIADGWIWLM
jgi:hypothetical protein